MASRRSLLVAAIAALVAACGGSMREFPVREPMWRDTDLVARRGKPAPYVSTSGWSLADQTVFRPLARFFAVDPAGEAVNVNAVDEVPDSSWFENRIGRRPLTTAELLEGPCKTGPLDPATFPDGSWRIDKGKLDGVTPGFRVVIPGRGRFMLKIDPAAIAPRSQAASVIGARLYWAAGYHTPCERIVTVKPSLFSIGPGLASVDNAGQVTPLTPETVAKLLSAGLPDGDGTRVSLSEFVEGQPLGPFTYAGLRKDDPNDVVRHEDRRDLRGMRLLAAWIHHFDSRDGNSFTSWIGGETGYVRHYLMDFSDSFGSVWAWDGISRRIGHSYYFDVGDIVSDFFGLGLVEKPWDRGTDEPVFHYYGIRDFDPAQWKPSYPNPAFGRMQERDGAWMARILARFTPEQIRALADDAGLVEDRARYLEKTLLARRQAILVRYFSRVSPLADVTVEGSELCAVDLARRNQTYPANLFRYASPGRDVTVRPDGVVCVALGAATRYQVVKIGNGIAAPLHIHVAHAGSFRVVGLLR